MLLLVAVAIRQVSPAEAVTVRIDYLYDTSHFFGSGNPQGEAAGLQARATLDAAAAFYSGILADTFSAIQTPPPFAGAFGGKVHWDWEMYFPNPSTGNAADAPPNQYIPTDEYVVFVGARDLPGTALGNGIPGTSGVSQSQQGTLTTAEQAQVAQIHIAFDESVRHRGESSGFANWGGALAIDSAANWQLDHTMPPAIGQSDLSTVAMHELAHVLGFGASAAWDAWRSGTTFVGPAAMSTFHQNGPVPLASALDRSHWNLSDTGSVVYGGKTSQQALMSPALPPGNRRFLTKLDAAALVDIGWEIDLTDLLPGDYNHNGLVDSADYTIWRSTMGSMSDLRADGDKTGASAYLIDQADYVVWKTAFGQSSSGGIAAANGVSANVPEPAGRLPLVAGMLAFSFSWRRNR